MKYRKEIDGLRALAVIPVIAFHAEFELFSGGFVGVDMFFVISGYLITTIIIEDLEKDQFTLKKFYERRARRILPALFFVMFCCLPFVWFWMLPHQTKAFSEALIAVVLFISNILFWKRSEDYFQETASEENPLLHTWSLAVEEQYYVFFPIFLIFAWRLGRQRVFWMIAFFLLISFLISEWGWRNRAVANFYLAPTRAWELLSGSLAAFIVQKRGVYSNNIYSLIGFFTLFLAIFLYDRTIPFPSFYTLLPVVGVVLIILFGGEQTFVAKLLSTRLLVSIGLISYSAYLWHQPLFTFARIGMISEPSQWLMLVLGGSSFVLAIISWRWVEQPFRDRKLFNPKQIFVLSALVIIVFLVIGFLGINGIYYKRYSPEVMRYFNLERNPHHKKCLPPNVYGNDDSRKHPHQRCTDFFVDNKAKVMFLGDSHSNVISYQAQKLLKQKGIGSYGFHHPSCVGLPGFYRIYHPNQEQYQCHLNNLSMLDFAKKSHISTIVITSRFPYNLIGVPFENQEDGIEGKNIAKRIRKGAIDLVEMRGKSNNQSDIHYHVSRISRVKAAYKSKVEALLKDFNVVLLYPIPEVGKYTALLRKCHLLQSKHCDFSTDYSAYLQYTKGVREAFDSISHERLYRVFPDSVLCNVRRLGRCEITNLEGDLLYSDSNHLVSNGAKLLAPLILKQVNKSLE